MYFSQTKDDVKRNYNRHTRRLKMFNSNFFKGCNFYLSRRVIKTLTMKTKKLSKCSFKKDLKLRNKTHLIYNYNNLLSTSYYKILSSKVPANSGKYIGLAITNLKIKAGFKNYAILKKTNYQQGSTFTQSSAFLISLFEGFRIFKKKYNMFSRINLCSERLVIPGCVVTMSQYKLGYTVFAVKNTLVKSVYATSPGTYCTILNKDYFCGTSLIKLPSTEVKTVCLHDAGIIGRCSNVMWRQQVFGKASSLFKIRKKKVQVRGVAMNPVDHPNGGRCKVKKPFRNVWGNIAKKNK